MTKNLSFERIPQYCFSANRQFEKGECHIERTYYLSVLLLVRRGVLRFTEDGVPIELSAGEYYIQKAGLHQQGPIPSDCPNYYYIHFKGHFSKAGVLPIRGRFDMNSVQSIIAEFDKLGNVGERLEYECLFYRLLSALRDRKPEKTVAEKLREYILEHFAENLTLEQLTHVSLLAKNQTINIFKDTYGVTPHRFIIDFRLQKAAEMLLATDTPITEIYFNVGFTEYSGFYKAFWQKYGISPKDYRGNPSHTALPGDRYYIP